MLCVALVAMTLSTDVTGSAGFTMTVPEGFAEVPAHPSPNTNSESAGFVAAGGFWLRAEQTALFVEPIAAQRISGRSCSTRRGSTRKREPSSQLVDTPFGSGCERHFLASHGRVHRLEVLVPFSETQSLKFSCWTFGDVEKTLAACRSALQSLHR